MNNYDTGICRVVTGALLLGGVISNPLPAIAQDELEEIVVTGSRIPRRDFTAPSPTTTIDNAELQLSGTTNLEDSLNRLPQVVPDYGRSSNNPGDGTSTVNLRGLGANRALILLNGRRMAPSTAFGTVNIDNIPAAMIERIEVVSGGASAVYGSDAITGAINFITRDNLEGINVSAQYDVTEEGDGQVLNLDISGGTPFAGGRGQISGFFNYNERDAVFQGDREFSSETITYDFFSGALLQGGSNNTPEGTTPQPFLLNGQPYAGRDLDGELFRVVYRPDGTPDLFSRSEDIYDFGPVNYLQVPFTRYTASLLADYDVGDASNIYTELMYVDSNGAQELAPTLLPSFGVNVTVDNPLYSPALQQFLRETYDEDPFGLDPAGTVDGIARVPIGKRFVEVGPRRAETQNDLLRFVAGMRGDFANAWSWDAHYVYADSSLEETLLNDVSFTRLQQSLLVDPATGQCTDTSGGCAPSNLFGAGSLSEEAAGFIRAAPLINLTENTQQIAHASVVGSIVELPAGPMDFAAGVEWREETSKFTPDDGLFTNDLLGFGIINPVDGEYSLFEVFGELRVPLLSDLPLARYVGIELGYRYSDHSIADTFDSWKVSGEWEIATGYRIRASLQQAVRVPNMTEYFESGSTDFDNSIANSQDRCSAELGGLPNPSAVDFAAVCVSQGLPATEVGTWVSTPNYETRTTFAGNALLEPEEARTVTAGLVIQPPQLEGLSISLDYYDIEIDNAITSLGAGDIVGLCFQINNPNDPVCRNIQRADGLTFNVSDVQSGPYNISLLQTSGVDLQIDYMTELPGWASIFRDGANLSIWLLANKTLEFGSQSTPDTEFLDCVGFFGFPCAGTYLGTLPEYRASTRFTYDSGPLVLSLQWQWLDGVDDAWPAYGLDLFGIPPEIYNEELPNIGSYSYLTLSSVYQINDDWSVYGGVHNLADRAPPLMAGNAVAANSDPSTYDMFGRRYFVGLTVQF